MSRTLLIPWFVALLAACPNRETPTKDGEAARGPTIEPPGTADEEGESPTTKAHMQEHFSKADEIEAALIAGKLADAREGARWMAEHHADVEHPEAWKPHVQTMREAAQRIGGAEQLGAATESFVQLAQACAQCHTALGGPEIDVGPPPKPDASDTVAAHMARHQWALDAMWQGLIGPSKDAWVAGAEVLAEAPLAPEELAPEQSVPKQIEELATRVHTLGNQARDVEDASNIPGQVYAELLTTCETCHAALRGEWGEAGEGAVVPDRTRP